MSSSVPVAIADPGIDSKIHNRRWVILGVMVLCLLIVVLDNSVLNVALKVLADPKKGLGASQSDLEWSINSYTLVFAGMLLSWGVLGDRVGRKRVLLIGFTFFGLASLASAYSHSPGELIGARALMGLGAAAVMPATLAIISNVFDPKERAKAIGIWAGAVGAGIAIGPIVGGTLLGHFWWGSVFLINVPIVVVGAVLIWMLVPESRNPNPGRHDPVGVVLEVVGLVLVIYSIIKAGDAGSVRPFEVWGTFVAGAVILVGFVWFERRSDHPTLDISLFKDPRFSAAVGSIGLVFFALLGTLFFMVFYLQSVRGYTPLQSGVRLLPFAIAQILSAPRSAKLVRRFGAKAVCTTGLLLVTASFAGYLTLGQHTSIWVLEGLFLIQGVGMGNIMPPATESIMSSVPREKAGAGSAINNVSRQVGGALGIAVLGSILAASYRSGIDPTLKKLPITAAVRGQMEKSVEATQAVVGKVGSSLQSAIPAGNSAFIHAMHVTSLFSAAVALAGTFVAFKFLPGRRNVGPATGAPAGTATPQIEAPALDHVMVSE
jgi:DHA2 family multidrug resistance protein-like MFS transporter